MAYWIHLALRYQTCPKIRARDLFETLSAVLPCDVQLGCVPSNRVESSRVQSRPVWLTKTRQRLFGLSVMAVRWDAYTPAESSRVESSRVESNESCRDKSLDTACFICVSDTLVTGRDRCCFEFRDGHRKADSFSLRTTRPFTMPLIVTTETEIT